MSNAPIRSAGQYPLSQTIGTLPQMADVLQDWFQPIKAMKVIKIQNQYETIERGDPIYFRGVLQPKQRDLDIKIEGERNWDPFSLWCETSVRLDTDDVVWIANRRYRVLSVNDFSAYGYLQYDVLQDYDDSEPPSVAPSPTVGEPFPEPGPPIPFEDSAAFSSIVDLSDPSFLSAQVSVIGDGGITDAFAAEWRVYKLGDDGSLTQYPDAAIQVVDELTVQITVPLAGVYQLNGVQ